MSDVERSHLEQLVNIYTKRLRVLEVAQAHKGLDTPPAILIELEEIQLNINKLQKTLIILQRSNEQVVQPAIEASVSPEIPPPFATYLLRFVPQKHRGDVIGDLAEEFQDINHEHGHRKAVIWYWGQVITSFWPFFISGIKRLVTWVTIGWIADAVRRFIL